MTYLVISTPQLQLLYDVIKQTFPLQFQDHRYFSFLKIVSFIFNPAYTLNFYTFYYEP